MRVIFLSLLVVTLGALVVGCGKKRGGEGEGRDTDPNKIGNVVIAPEQPAAPKGGPGKWGTFTVGKNTTVVSGPVEKDGHIDYAAALNECLSKGVTPEDNANVGIWKALGPSPADAKVPAAFFDKLGMQPPPAQGDYYTDLVQYTRAGGPN